MKLIIANWKMHKTIAEAEGFIRQFSALARGKKSLKAKAVICPGFVALAKAKEAIKGNGLGQKLFLGAQNMHYLKEGAYTGEISYEMLKGIADYVIVGHSERRMYFNETDSIINKKLKAAIENSIIPILCVGETIEEKEKGLTKQVLKRQLEAGLKDTDSSKAIVAYEPVWAISRGEKKQAAMAHDIRAATEFIKSIASPKAIVYGGSVNSDNITELLNNSLIDGALVGSASLDAESFFKMVSIAESF